jgi:hypothetical protein
VRFLPAPALMLAILATPPAGAVSFPLITLALSGQQPPGAPDGASFTQFHVPSTGGANHAAFSGEFISAPGAQPVRGLWATGPDANLALLAQEGGEVPDIPGAQFDFIGPWVNQSAQVGVSALLKLGPGGVTMTNDQALFAPDASGQLRLVARKGDPVPGLGTTWTSVTGTFTDSGSVLLRGLVGAQPSGQVLAHRELDGTFHPIVIPGDSLPGSPAGWSVRSIGETALSGGDVVFSAEVADDPSDPLTARLSGIWRWNPDGGLSPVLAPGEALPGIDPAPPQQAISFLAGNPAGDLVVLATADYLTTLPDVQGLWRALGGSDELAPVAMAGDPAPDVPGRSFEFFGFAIALNDEGRVAFSAHLDDDDFPPSLDSGGMWLEVDGELRLLFRGGDRLPGAEDRILTDYAAPLLNDLGELVMEAELAEDLEAPGEDAIFFATNPSNRRVLLRKGDELEIAPGDRRIVSFIGMNDGETAALFNSPALNDASQIALRIEFTDGTQGTFLLTVPEPGSALLLLTGLAARAALCRPPRSRRRRSGWPTE